MHRDDFTLYVSEPVLDEAAAGDSNAAAKRLAALPRATTSKCTSIAWPDATIIGFDPGDIVMFALDLPDVPHLPPAFVVAQARPTQSGNADRTIGVCFPMENSPLPSGIHSSAISPLGAVRNYYRSVETRDIGEIGTVTLLEDVAHGVLKEFDGGKNYEYVPTPGYYGEEQATLLVDIAGVKVKVIYFFHVQQVINDADEEKLCPTPYWKISATPNGSGTFPFTNYTLNSVNISLNFASLILHGAGHLDISIRK